MHYGYSAMKWLDIEATNANFVSLKFRATLQASPILQYYYTPKNLVTAKKHAARK